MLKLSILSEISFKNIGFGFTSATQDSERDHRIKYVVSVYTQEPVSITVPLSLPQRHLLTLKQRNKSINYAPAPVEAAHNSLITAAGALVGGSATGLSSEQELKKTLLLQARFTYLTEQGIKVETRVTSQEINVIQ